jgi:hypothetical protein
MIKALRVLLIRSPNNSYHGLSRIFFPGMNPALYGSPSGQAILSLGSCSGESTIDLNRGSKSEVINEALFSANPALPANVLAHLASMGCYASSNEIFLSGVEGLVGFQVEESLLSEARNKGVPAYVLDNKYCLNEVNSDGTLRPYLPHNIVSFDPRMKKEDLQSVRGQLEKNYRDYISLMAKGMEVEKYESFKSNQSKNLLEPVTHWVMSDVHMTALNTNLEYSKKITEIEKTSEEKKLENKAPNSVTSSREESERILAEAAVKDEKYLWDRNFD